MAQIKLSSLYCEGSFDPDIIETVYMNFPYFFRGDIMRADRNTCNDWRRLFPKMDVYGTVAQFNSYALYEHIRSAHEIGELDETYIMDLIRYGADAVWASKEAEKPNSEERRRLEKLRGCERLYSRRNVLEYVRNKYGPDGRKHTREAIHVRCLGPEMDYCNEYRFPCCRSAAICGDHAPSLYRDNGCEAAVPPEQ